MCLEEDTNNFTRSGLELQAIITLVRRAGDAGARLDKSGVIRAHRSHLDAEAAAGRVRHELLRERARARHVLLSDAIVEILTAVTPVEQADVLHRNFCEN